MKDNINLPDTITVTVHPHDFRIIPITNGDIIRHMTDEELAHFISEDYYVPHCPTYGPCLVEGEHEGCEECWLEWLKQESEG